MSGLSVTVHSPVISSLLSCSRYSSSSLLFLSSSLPSVDSFSVSLFLFPILLIIFFPLQTSLGLIHSKPSAVSGQSPSRQRWTPGAAGGRDPGQEAETRSVIGPSSDLVDFMYYFQPIKGPAKFGIGAGRNIYRCLFCPD